jgi:pimeloyl-ACP methyl ester carboxylesterase
MPFENRRRTLAVGQRTIRWPAAVLLFLGLTGCVLWQPRGPAAAEALARQGRFEGVAIKAGPFTLAAWLKVTRPGAPLSVYVEGDGAAWIDRTWRSDDPTPKKPLALELAALDPAANVACLARPGQYPTAGTAPCDPAYWSDRRFAPEVVAAMDEAVGLLAARAQSSRVHLVGYSGGGAIAVLIAAGRSDVESLRTVAGNLDPATVNLHHRVSPLHRESRDPLAAAAGLCRLPQRHFVGAGDPVVPPFVAQAFVKRAGFADEAAITVVPGATHGEGWFGPWRELLGLPLAACRGPAAGGSPCLAGGVCVDSNRSFGMGGVR